MNKIICIYNNTYELHLFNKHKVDTISRDEYLLLKNKKLIDKDIDYISLSEDLDVNYINLSKINNDNISINNIIETFLKEYNKFEKRYYFKDDILHTEIIESYIFNLNNYYGSKQFVIEEWIEEKLRRIPGPVVMDLRLKRLEDLYKKVSNLQKQHDVNLQKYLDIILDLKNKQYTKKEQEYKRTLQKKELKKINKDIKENEKELEKNKIIKEIIKLSKELEKFL